MWGWRGAALVLAALMTTAAPASASGWTLESTPNPSPLIQARLVGVSCPTTTWCAAAGFYSTGPTDVAYVAQRTAGVWTIGDLPLPVPNAMVFPTAISCATQQLCVVVGSWSASPGGSGAYVARWDGASWTSMTVATPDAAWNLVSVSCPTTTYCVALGDTPFFPKAFALVFDGTSWTLQRMVRLPGAMMVALSCASPSSCTAVGRQIATIPMRAVIEHWDGTTWTRQVAPPFTGLNALVSGVSCPSASRCVAVGATAPTSGGVNTAMTMRWNGTFWRVVADAAPPGASLAAVSCADADHCWAVGVSDLSIVEHASNGTWTVDQTPHAPNAYGEWLDAVSCPTVSSCVAVGRADASTEQPFAIAGP